MTSLQAWGPTGGGSDVQGLLVSSDWLQEPLLLLEAGFPALRALSQRGSLKASSLLSGGVSYRAKRSPVLLPSARAKFRDHSSEESYFLPP